MRSDLRERLQNARKAFGDDAQGGGVVGRGAPLGYRIKSYSGHAARIEVWFVGMATSPGSSSPSGEFGTYSVDLTWERGAWRLAGEPDRQAGPAPVIKTAASSAEVVHAQIKDFKEFNHVAP